MHHYRRADVVRAMRSLGVVPGDLVFSHVGLGFLGYPEGDSAPGLLLEAMDEVLGAEGTWVTPTFTYSFTKEQPYDPEHTPSTVGAFSNFVLGQPGWVRSADPIFSVAGRGSAARPLLSDLPRDCFGKDCVYDRLIAGGAKLCNFGVGFRYATIVHHVEQEVGVPYRFLKTFSGTMGRAGAEEPQDWVYYVRHLCAQSVPDLSRLEERATKQGLLRTAPLGLSNVTCITAGDFARLTRECLDEDPWMLVKGPAFEPLKTPP